MNYIYKYVYFNNKDNVNGKYYDTYQRICKITNLKKKKIQKHVFVAKNVAKQRIENA